MVVKNPFFCAKICSVAVNHFNEFFVLCALVPHPETFPVLQQRMRLVIQTEMQLAQMEEKYLDTESLNIDNSLERCKKLTGTLVTMKR